MTNKTKKNLSIIAAFAGTTALFAAIIFSALPSKASANPSQMNAFTSCQTNQLASTTGPTNTKNSDFLSPGLATSTLNCNVPIASNGAIQTFDSATMLVQLTASSTATDLSYWIEDSQDGVDYYPRVDVTILNATTSPQNQTPKIYDFRYASSTANSGNLAAGRAHYSVPVSFNTKYMRVLFFLPTGSLNGAVWAQIVGKNQILY